MLGVAQCLYSSKDMRYTRYTLEINGRRIRDVDIADISDYVNGTTSEACWRAREPKFLVLYGSEVREVSPWSFKHHKDEIAFDSDKRMPGYPT